MCIRTAPWRSLGMPALASTHFSTASATSFCVALLLLMVFTPRAANAAASVGPSVKDVIEFTHIVPQGFESESETLERLVAPDRRRALVVTRRGSVATDKNCYELLMLDLEPARLQAGRPRKPERLLEVESVSDAYVHDPALTDVRWINDTTIVYRARLADGHFQAYSLDLRTRRPAQLTRSPTSIWSFDVSDDLKQTVYVVTEPPEDKAPNRSIIVANKRFSSLFPLQTARGYRALGDLIAAGYRYRYYVATSGSVAPPRPLGDGFVQWTYPPLVRVSPDGRWALLKVHEPDATRVAIWEKRYPAFVKRAAQNNDGSIDPAHYFSHDINPFAEWARLRLYRLETGEGEDILGAPLATALSAATGQDRLWRRSRSGVSVIVSGTYLPVRDGTEASENTRPHLIEYWPETRQWKVLASLALEGPSGSSSAVQPVAGTPDSFIMLDWGKARRFDRAASGEWKESAGETPAATTTWRLRIEEAWNKPRNVVATAPDKASVPLTDLNPQFSTSTWGELQPFNWKGLDGYDWKGALLLPDNYDPSKKYPLVIQTYGTWLARGDFYLENAASSFTSAFPGRALAREGMMMLAVPDNSLGVRDASKLRAALLTHTAGVKAAINVLVEQGKVDRERVGIIGFSYTGSVVQHLITFSDATIRAATIADALSNSLFDSVIVHGHIAGVWFQMENRMGAQPFGDSVKQWIARDASLQTHCLTAALRLEQYGNRNLTTYWDTYALLRRQYKAAELVVLPEGEHNLARPSDRMVSLQGNVDWFNFWLQGKERTDVLNSGETEATLRQRYARWRQMAEFKKTDDAKPRCPPGRDLE
jgi:hypothetical protein